MVFPSCFPSDVVVVNDDVAVDVDVDDDDDFTAFDMLTTPTLLNQNVLNADTSYSIRTTYLTVLK